ncbi:MAG: hypothetical protein DRQ08_02180 [Candidatus Latescibacterota bacterium]|nr:MAG: hypothetical protein DRQ08_02180 [Candidatus Latescibacterota bacterium]
MSDFALNPPFRMRPVTLGPKHHFFGYYDKSPWDSTGRYMLGMEVGFVDRPPTPEDEVVIGLIDLEEGARWNPVAKTRAWCWQQGCMLQWMPSAPEEIIYNDREGGRFVSRVLDVRTGRSRTLPLPIYALSPDGSYALTLNFSRVARTRPGYGYVGVPDPYEGEPAPEGDGIWWMDLRTGEHKLIISLAEVASLGHDPTMDDTEHWFNHIQVNTDGTRFLFLHRWKRPDGGWWTRMFTARPDGSELYCVADHGMVSHFDWRDQSHILAWATQRDVGDRFFLFEDLTGRREVVGEGVLTENGHCSYSPDRRWILTDTYPDHDSMRHLLLFRLEDGKLLEVGKFFSPPELRGEIRCDLHPRWSRDGREVCIDSAHEGHRQMYVVEVGEAVFSGERLSSEGK